MTRQAREARIRALHAKGVSATDIAVRLACPYGVVRKVVETIEREGAQPPTASPDARTGCADDALPGSADEWRGGLRAVATPEATREPIDPTIPFISPPTRERLMGRR